MGRVMDLEEVWRIREEEVYPRLFGGSHGGNIFTLSGELFVKRFGAESYDPRWLMHGVMEFAPTATRDFWLYVTSGYSNPWDDEPENYGIETPSGSGVEFLFATHEAGEWAIRFLQNMLAFDMLLTIGHFGEKPPLAEGNRIPLRSPINGVEGCLIRNAILSKPELLPSGFALPSGEVEFLTFTGTTDVEIDFAKEQGTDALVERLIAAGQYPVTDPGRSSIV